MTEFVYRTRSRLAVSLLESRHQASTATTSQGDRIESFAPRAQRHPAPTADGTTEDSRVRRAA